MGPSQGVTQQSEPHECSPSALLFEGKTQEETLQQDRCARRDAWEMSKNVHELEEKDNAEFYSLPEVWTITSAIFDEALGKSICGGFRNINAHAKQERPVLR